MRDFLFVYLEMRLFGYGANFLQCYFKEQVIYMRNQKTFPVVILLSAFVWILLSSCNADPKTGGGTIVAPEKVDAKAKRAIPKFEQDSAYQYIKKQVEFGIRLPGTPTHKACKEWLSAKLKSFGATVIEQDFEAHVYTGAKLPATNIVGQFNPGVQPRIVLAAHWDSRHIAEEDPDPIKKAKPILGADDGASGVGVLLEIARLIGKNGLDIGVDIVFFDAEDHGSNLMTPNPTDVEILKNRETWCLGSQYWSKNPHTPAYRAKYGILLDMVGAKNARFPLEGYSKYYAPNIQKKIWRLAKGMGFGNQFVEAEGGAITDDHLFVNTIAKIPMVDIIHLTATQGKTFGAHWHTHTDDLSVIDKRTLKAVGRVVTAVVYRENNGEF